MKKYIKADDSDYVKIGNMILPKNASDFGYGDSYESVAQRTRYKYDREKAEEAERARIAELQKKAEPLYNSVLDAIEKSGKSDIDTLFEVLVPDSGKCDNLAGEIIRAMMRILYRDYNDGDRFFSGYGLETCGSSAEFLMYNTSPEIDSTIIDIARSNLEGDRYTEAIENLANNLVIPYVLDHKELFATETPDSRDYSIDEISKYQPKYDFSFYVESDVVKYLFDEGVIGDEEIRDWLESCMRNNRFSSGELSRYRIDDLQDVEINDLNEDDYDAAQHYFHQWVRGFEEDLENEYSEYLTDYYGDDDDDYYDDDDED